MAPPVKLSYELVKQIIERLKNRNLHKKSRIPIDSKELAKGYLYPTIKMTLIAKESQVSSKTLYRLVGNEPKVKKMLLPFMSKARNEAMRKPGDQPRKNTKAWMEQRIKKLVEELERCKAKRIDLKIKNLQIQSLSREIENKGKQVDKAKIHDKENKELQREVGRLQEENSRMRHMLMLGEHDQL